MTLLKSKKYKAIIFDIDGTLILNDRHAMPSLKVISAIEKASKLIHVGIATGRPLFIALPVFNHLKFKGLAIVNGGSQIIDISSNKTLWEQTINMQDLEEIIRIFKKMRISFIVTDNDRDVKFFEEYKPKKPFQIWVHGTNNTDQIIDSISHISTITGHKILSWNKGETGLMITHAAATKQHAIFEIAKLLEIDTHEIIGVGDGYNDFPLLMACGLKVAMGNAVPELKEIADYIAPPVEKDGVADIIEKFVL
ncbi:MAG: HAD-IIB family hydrolase [Candidatus Levybacteria bacterium]|nr:HAD-IIB family hydrolase [Candidatus Levybacteria bacterium]